MSADDAMNTAATTPDGAPSLDEIQGHILNAYPDAHCARLVFFHFAEPAAGRTWLEGLLDRVTFEADTSKAAPLNVAFTYAGLAALEIAPSSLSDFAQASTAFREGMAARAERLGDATPSAPPSWWSDTSKTVHAVVTVHAALNDATRAALKALGTNVRAYSSALPPPAITPVAQARDLLDRRYAEIVPVPPPSVVVLGSEDTYQPLTEHSEALELFGFRDGISQPVALAGARPTALFGSFIVGGPPSLLTGGSFLVIRQLEQDLDAFWTAMRRQALKLSKEPDEIAAMVMGRQLDGTPLGGKGDPADDTAAFDPASDGKGATCPFMSHVRRANPRIDAAAGANPRIMRRSMSYVNAQSRGQMFMAYNADITAQFELIQSRWLQRGTAVGGRTIDHDVIAGQSRGPDTVFNTGAILARFSSFVRFGWGEYFFAPSKSALARIAAGRSADDATADERVAADLRTSPAAASLAAREKLIGTWLDTPDQALRFWMYVKRRGGLRIERAAGEPWVFVADGERVDAILADDGRLFSVEGYAERMRQSTGRFFLGMDPYTDTYERERRSSAIIPGWRAPGWKAGDPDTVLGAGAENVRDVAFAAAQGFLRLNRVRAGISPKPDVAAPFDLNVLLAVTFDAVCSTFFGVPGHGAGSLVTWAADVTMYYFRAAADAIDAGKGRQSGMDYASHVAQLVDQALQPQPAAKPNDLADADWNARRRLIGVLGILRDALGPAATQEDLARNLVGVMTGSLTATIALFTGALTANAERGRGALTFAGAPAAAGTGEFPRYDAFVEKPLVALGRGGPDHLYRHYKGEKAWGPLPGITPGDIAVVWVGGAARDLRRGSLFFGGAQHHCPGERMGKALIDGVVGALAELKNPTFDPVTLVLRSEAP